MLAVVRGGHFVGLFRLMARCHRLVRQRLFAQRLMRGLSLMRERAAQHGSRRKRLHRQDQHHQDQQKSVYEETHWVSVAKKQGASNRPSPGCQGSLAGGMAYERRLRGS